MVAIRLSRFEARELSGPWTRAGCLQTSVSLKLPRLPFGPQGPVSFGLKPQTWPFGLRGPAAAGLGPAEYSGCTSFWFCRPCRRESRHIAVRMTPPAAFHAQMEVTVKGGGWRTFPLKKPFRRRSVGRYIRASTPHSVYITQTLLCLVRVREQKSSNQRNGMSNRAHVQRARRTEHVPARRRSSVLERKVAEGSECRVDRSICTACSATNCHVRMSLR